MPKSKNSTKNEAAKVLDTTPLKNTLNLLGVFRVFGLIISCTDDFIVTYRIVYCIVTGLLCRVILMVR